MAAFSPFRTVLPLLALAPALVAQTASQAASRVDVQSTRVLGLQDLIEAGRAAPSAKDSEFKFEVVLRSDALPDEVREPNPHDRRKRPILECAHGGFAFDPRPGHGEVYWFLQGAGILRVSKNRKSVDLLETTKKLTKWNLHNATYFQQGDKPRIAWPAEAGGRVFITDLKGKVLHEIGRPQVEPYTKFEKARFAPTDTAWLDDLLWITDGYGSKFVTAYDLGEKAWSERVFGGPTKEPKPGVFGTNHGITMHKGLLYVSGRFFARIHRVNPKPAVMDMFPLPEGSKPCDFEFFNMNGKLYGVAASLNVAKGVKGSGASVHIVDMETLEIVGSVSPKDDLGLEKFVHLHNVFPVVENGRLTLFCQAWNPGDFAILRQVAPK